MEDILPPTAAEYLPAKVWEEYNSGRMHWSSMMEVEKDVKEGHWNLRDGMVMQKTEVPSLMEKITGERDTTPEVEAMPGWMSIPELRENSWAGLKSAIGTLMSDPEETVRVMKANHPNIDVRRDEWGTIIMRSAIDGKDYPIKKGLRYEDIVQAIPLMASYIPAGKALTIPGSFIAHAATQFAIEGSQAMTGGEFDEMAIAESGTLGSIGTGVINKGKEWLNRAPEVKSLEETMHTAAKGGRGSKRATQVLASSADVDPSLVSAADDLGVTLPSEMLSTNQVYKDVVNSVKSIPGSQAKKAGQEEIVQIAKRANDVIEELGGTHDLSSLSHKVKTTLEGITDDLWKTSKALYQEVDNALVGETNPATNIIKFINDKKKLMGGTKADLDPIEREILSQLYSKPIKVDGKIVGYKHPTYSKLEKIRKKFTKARVKGEVEEVFATADKQLIKDLEKELMKDQMAVAAKFGLEDTLKTAGDTVAIRKGLENDLKALFGKQINESLIGNLTKSMNQLPKGNVEKFTKFIEAVPKEMREEVTASGLLHAFGISAEKGHMSFTGFSNWYQGLLKNRRSYSALMSNLPKEAKKRLENIYRISKAISRSTKEGVPGRKSMLIQKQIDGAEGFASRVYHATKTGVKVGAIAAAPIPGVAKGAGMMAALASGLSKNKKDVVRAADELLLSYAFRNAVTEFGTAGERTAIANLAKSNMFKSFANKIKLPKSVPGYERWILAGLQSGRQLKKENK